jgi:hypothetical protein
VRADPASLPGQAFSGNNDLADVAKTAGSGFALTLARATSPINGHGHGHGHGHGSGNGKRG